MSMLRVLGRPTSINVRKVLVALGEIGLAYDHEPQWASPAAPASSSDFVKLNPNALVPVIVDGDFVMWESNAICRYLANKYGRDDLFPAEARARAVVDMWMDWQATDLNATWRAAFLGLMRKDPAYAAPEIIAASAARWNAAMAILNARIEETGAFVAGATYTLADICVGLAAHRWRATPIAHARLPAVDAWMARLDARPAFARYATPDYP